MQGCTVNVSLVHVEYLVLLLLSCCWAAVTFIACEFICLGDFVLMICSYTWHVFTHLSLQQPWTHKQLFLNCTTVYFEDICVWFLRSSVILTVVAVRIMVYLGRLCQHLTMISQVCVLSVELVSRTRDSSTEREKHSYLEPLIRCTRKQQWM